MKNENITSIAIGGFDGMHKAHQELFRNLDENGAIVVIETGYANMTPSKTRAYYTDRPIFYFELQSIKHLDGEAFIALLLENFPQLQRIVVGYDFYFGKNRFFSADDLKSLFQKEVVIVPEYTIQEKSVHSRIIREYIMQGDIQKANTFLGHEYTIEGSVISGQGLGGKYFVSTLNLSVDKFLLPGDGIYVAQTVIDGKLYRSVVFLGKRSTDQSFAVEVHILDPFDGCNCDVITLSFLKKLRDPIVFTNTEDLLACIKHDIATAKIFFEQL